MIWGLLGAFPPMTQLVTKEVRRRCRNCKKRTKQIRKAYSTSMVLPTCHTITVEYYCTVCKKHVRHEEYDVLKELFGHD